MTKYGLDAEHIVAGGEKGDRKKKQKRLISI
jgi:hypothetical protein